MDCASIRDNLLAWLDGELSAAERAAIEAHLATCSGCAAELERLRALRGSLRDAIPAGLAQVRLPRAAEDRIRTRLRAAQARRRPRWTVLLRRGLIRAAVPLVTILFVVATLLLAQPLPASAQETFVIAPASLAPDTDAALRVVVRDRGSARPIAGAEVRVSLQPQGGQESLLYAGRTGDQGSAEVRFRVPDYPQDALAADLVVVTASRQGEDRVQQRVTVRRSYRLYLSSDKPLYRPGQTMHVRVLALEAVRGLPAEGRQVLLQVQGTQGERLWEARVRASAYGIAAAEYALPASAAHGTYRLVAALGDAVSSRTVTVGAYERPRFRVQVAAARPYYLPGEAVEGQVTARQLDDRPLSGAAATLRAYLRDPERRLVAVAEGRADDAGIFAFRFGLPAGLGAASADLILEATAVDEGGQAEWAGRVLPIAAEPLAIDVVAEGGRLRPGVENVVYLLVATPDGRPAQARLDVNAGGRAYVLETDAYGLAEFHLTPPAGTRDVPVHLVAQEGDGRAVERDLLLSADRGPAQVLLRLDRAAYEVGETMQVQVFAGQGEVVYLDVARDGGGQAMGTYLARLRGGQAVLSIDVAPEMAGTLVVNAYQVLPDGTLVRDARLAVVDAPAAVQIEVQPDRATYRPGEVARVALDTTLDGGAVQSAVGIAVVDESVFALEERAPGFAKLFFLLEDALLQAAAEPTRVDLAALLDPQAGSEVRAAQDQAARAAWAALPMGPLDLVRSTLQPQSRDVSGRMAALGRWLAAALLCLSVAIWAAAIVRVRRGRAWGPALWRAGAIWIGLAFAVVLPLASAVLAGLALWLGPVVGRLLLSFASLAWVATLAALIVYAGRQKDEGAQAVLLLFASYAVLAALLGYAAGRGADPGAGLALALAAAFLGTLAALLALAAAFWVERRRAAALLLAALALASVAVAVLAGGVWIASSRYVRTLADPQVYAGPVGWLAGCAPAPAATTVGKEAEQVVRETVVVEKEVEVEVTRQVEKEVTRQVETEATRPVAATATQSVQEREPTATQAPAATPAAPREPTPTAAATASPTPAAELAPPLLGQFVPETIYWAPEAITDRGGHLEVEIPLPPVEATWRLTALASTREGQLGAAMLTIRSTP